MGVFGAIDIAPMAERTRSPQLRALSTTLWKCTKNYIFLFSHKIPPKHTFEWHVSKSFYVIFGRSRCTYTFAPQYFPFSAKKIQLYFKLNKQQLWTHVSRQSSNHQIKKQQQQQWAMTIPKTTTLLLPPPPPLNNNENSLRIQQTGGQLPLALPQ